MKIEIINWNTGEVINTATSVLDAVEFIRANDLTHVNTILPEEDVFVTPERALTTLVTYVLPKGEVE